MKAFKILFFIFLLSSNIYAKELKTTCGSFPVNLYNIAIVGNSHASYMSDFIGVDNDLHSIMVGNHSVGGDDLLSYGFSNKVTTDWNYGEHLIGIKGDAKGWIKEFIKDSSKIEYAICWFGSNSLTKDINKFKEEYKSFIDNVIDTNPNCKLIIMEIPYTKFKTYSYNHSKENIDNFNKEIKNLIKDYNNPNIIFENIGFDYTYIDRVHLSKETYIQIWNNLSQKYNLKAKVIEKNSKPIKWVTEWKPYSWVKIGDYWKYRNNLDFVKNTWIDGYYIDENGNWNGQIK